jgi:hypothetical protein
MKFALKIIAGVIVGIFALIGAASTAVFVGMNYGALNVRGSIVERNAFFGRVPTIGTTTDSTTGEIIAGNGCREPLSQTTPCEWSETIQWDVVKGGLQKDVALINRVAAETGVSARMIAAAVVPEQTRFFADNREVFKRYFEPLKLLASLSQFSLGVSGIKQETARAIENHTNDPASPFYPGADFAALIAYSSTTTDRDHELFLRLTDEKNHYYSYLYTALYLKQIETQWKNAGYDIAKRPDVLVTLFNLGFQASLPKANPKVAGATITIGDQSYSFGYLGTLFYQSEELRTELPE